MAKHRSNFTGGDVVAARQRIFRRGVTMIELLAGIAIIGILVSLSLMGIQSARETSRRVQCLSHLRQIGLAIANYEASFNVFPAGLSNYGSVHVAILPYLEHHALYETLVDRFQRGEYSQPDNLPIIPLYRCPSDTAVDYVGNHRLVGTNYAGNSGTWHLSDGWNGVLIYWEPGSLSDQRNGESRPIRSSDIRDGLSNTVMMSEILRANGLPGRFRTNWNTPALFREIDRFADQCRSVPEDAPSYGWRGNMFARGIPWINGNLGNTLYNHVLTPNLPSCYNGGDVPNGASTACSSHSFGVNTLFADGSSKFQGESIDKAVWRSVASRDGLERQSTSILPKGSVR